MINAQELVLVLMVLLLLVVLMVAIWNTQRGYTSRAVGAELDQMDEAVFERYLALLFTRMGYQVRRINYADNVSTLVATGHGLSYVIQAQRNRHKVGIKAIKDVIATRKHLKCERAIVVTNHFFSNQARQMAKANQVITLDRHDLIKELARIKSSSAFVNNGDSLE
ncbi:MAG TPA: restriction endonuclease [Syntrophomonadaceae bacterium]|nr:restriction endonuclease [Syntrophomonadaceae bacterium]